MDRRLALRFRPFVRGRFGETSDHFSSASLVPSTQQRLDLVMEVESVKHIEGGTCFVCSPDMGVSLLPIFGEGLHGAQAGRGKRLVLRPQTCPSSSASS